MKRLIVLIGVAILAGAGVGLWVSLHRREATSLGVAVPIEEHGNGQIAYLLGPRTTAPFPPRRLFVAAPDGSTPVPITASASLEDLAWSPDGARLAYVDSGGEFGSATIYLVNADGSAREVFLSPTRPLVEIAGISWSPDGRWLAYSEATGGTSVASNQTAYHLFVKPLGGGAPIQLSSGVDNQLFPAWSPDGTEIAYENAVPNFASSSIKVMGADGGGVRTILPRDAEIGGFSWSPNSISITFGEKGSLHIVRADGADDHVIYRCPSACEIGATTYSPDGALIGFEVSSARSEIIRTISVQGTGLRPLRGVLPGDACCLSWQPTNPAPVAAT